MSLTIQAPHANMNAYEIGDDETRKNKVSDKGTIYAGDLQFAQTTGNAASDKKQSARKQAMKLIRDAWDSDNKAVSQRDQMAQQKEEKRKEVRACDEELKQVRESKEIVRQSYGVDPDSQEQKDLELLEKYQDYQKGVQTDDFSKEEIDRLKELQNTPLTDYQTRALQLNAQKDVILNKKDRAQRNVTSLTEAAADAKLDQLKSQDMQKAQDAADELLDASDKDAFGMLIQDAVDHIDEKQEEEKEKAEKEKAEEAQEKRDEQQEKIDEKKEEKQQQEKMIEGSVEADRLEADVTVDQTGTSKLEEAQQHIQTILKKNNLVNEDLKGIKIDLNF